MRGALVIAHRWLGLALAGLLIMAGLTGSIIAFEREVDRALNPDLFVTASRGPALPVDRIVANVERGFPGYRVSAVQPAWTAGETVMLRVEPGRDAAAQIDQVFADPVSGEILGARLWGGCCFGRRQFVPFLYKLHYSLHLPGSWGLLLMGGAALAWMLDCFVGLALAVPRGGRWRQGWKRALSVKFGASRYRVTFDLHRAGALWVWLLLLMLATTGVALNLREQVFKPVVSLFSDLTPRIFDGPRSEPLRSRVLSYGEAITAASEAVVVQHAHLRPAYAFYAEGVGAYGVAVAPEGADPRDGLGPSWIYVDHHSGQIVTTEFMGRGSAGDVFLQAQLPLHSGRIIGLPGRAAISALGLVTAMLSMTGIVIWRRKRAARLAHVVDRRTHTIGSIAGIG